MRKTSQWKQQRHTARVQHKAAKQRARHQTYRPRTTGYKRPDAFSEHMRRRISRGDLLKVLGFALDGYDVQPVGTWLRQKKVA